MLYSGNTKEKIEGMFKENNDKFEHCKAKMDSYVYDEMVEIITGKIRNETIIDSFKFTGECLSLAKFQPIKDACKVENNEIEVMSAKQFFELILLNIMINKDENDNWDVYTRRQRLRSKTNKFKEYIKRV